MVIQDTKQKPSIPALPPIASVHSSDGSSRRARSSFSNRTGSSDEYHATSRFVEAMRNPNWRRRRTENESSASTDTHASSTMPKDPGNFNFKEEPRFAIHSSSTTQHVYAPEPNKNRALEHDPVKNSIYEEDLSGLPGICNVLRHMDFPGLQSGDKPLSIMELAPLTNVEHSSNHPPAIRAQEPTRVEIQRIRKRVEPPVRTIYRNQDEQVAAALQAAGRTPEKIKMAQQIPRNGQFGSRTQKKGQVVEAWNLAINKPTVANLGKASLHCEVGGKGERQGHQQNGRSQPHIGRGEQRDIAFQKMLQKLQKGVGSDSTTSRTVADQSCSGVKDEHGTSKLTTKKELSRPENIKRSEPGSEGNPGSEDIKDQPGRRPDRPKSNTWNPRAREFLSLHEDRKSSIEEPAQPQPGGGTDLETLLVSLNANLEHDDGNRVKIGEAPFCEPVPLIIPGFAHFSSAGSTATSAAVGGFDDNPYTPPIGPIHAFGPFSNATTLPLLGLRPRGTLPAVGSNTFQPMFPIPYADVSTLPMGTPGQHEKMYACNVGPASGAYLPPVPKPRKPDPRDQQQYEAWIEWRKANEPGYAMECKLRQQRRAQKTRASKSKTVVTEDDTR